MPRHKFTKEDSVKGGKSSKGSTKSKTKVARQTLGMEESYEVRLKVLQNMKEALYSKDKAERQRATRDYADYFVPKKREHSGDLLNDIVIEVKIAEN